MRDLRVPPASSIMAALVWMLLCSWAVSIFKLGSSVWILSCSCAGSVSTVYFSLCCSASARLAAAWAGAPRWRCIWGVTQTTCPRQFLVIMFFFSSSLHLPHKVAPFKHLVLLSISCLMSVCHGPQALSDIWKHTSVCKFSWTRNGVFLAILFPLAVYLGLTICFLAI